MTNEERLDRLETIVKELINDYAQLVPTLARQSNPDGSTSTTTGSVPVKGFGSLRDETGKIKMVVVYPQDDSFSIGDTTRRYNLDFTIDGFAETANNYYACLSGPCQLTVPVGDLTPLTTGGMSANWASKVKEWEITAFRDRADPDNIHYNYDRSNLDAWLNDPRGSVATGDWEIYSVKRLSDGSTWALGDETTTGIITLFSIHDGFMRAYYDADQWERIEILKKKPAPSVKEWEIVEFRGVKDNSSWLRNEQGNYRASTAGSLHTLKSMLYGRTSVEDGSILIHSVRRLSDNTVWSLGQRVGKKGCPNLFGTIDRFSFTENVLFAEYKYEQEGLVRSYICNLTEAPRKPLFTTADGVKVFEGDRVYNHFNRGRMVERKWSIYWQNQYENPGEIFYSTREAALCAYNKWLYDQPVLTFKDVITYDHTQLKKLVKDKLAKS